MAVFSFGLPTVLRAQLVPSGGEFQVNTHTTSRQTDANIAAGPNGDFVVTWASYDQDGDWVGVFGQRYGTGATPTGVEFQVNSFTTLFQYQPAVAYGPGGDFLVSWVDTVIDSNIVARRFDSAGNPQGTEFQVNSSSGYHASPAAVFDTNGGFLVAWTGLDSSGAGIHGQRFASDGNPQGSEFQINAFTTGAQTLGGIAGTGSGFVIAWTSPGQDGDGDAVVARRYDSDGTALGTEFVVNTTTVSDQDSGRVAADAAGNFVIAWSAAGNQDGNGSGIFGRRYDSGGNPVGSEFQVNTYTSGQQTRPAIAINATGEFAVAWDSSLGDGSAEGVFARAFHANGAPNGGDVQVNVYSTNFQIFPSIAAASDGSFVVAWESNYQDGDINGVFARRFVPAGTPINGKKLLLRTPAAGPTKNKIVFLSDTGVDTPQGIEQDPRCPPLGSGLPASGARLRVVGDGGDFTIDLPCVNWSANGDETTYKYRDGSGATCSAVIIKPGLLKAICKGPQVEYTLGSPQGDVYVTLGTGDPSTNRKYCASFGPLTSATVVNDGAGGKKYKALSAGPGVCQ